MPKRLSFSFGSGPLEVTAGVPETTIVVEAGDGSLPAEEAAEGAGVVELEAAAVACMRRTEVGVGVGVVEGVVEGPMTVPGFIWLWKADQTSSRWPSYIY